MSWKKKHASINSRLTIACAREDAAYLRPWLRSFSCARSMLGPQIDVALPPSPKSSPGLASSISAQSELLSCARSWLKRSFGHAIARKLSFKCEIMIVPAKEIIDLVRRDPFAGQPSGPTITRFVNVLHRPLGTRGRTSGHFAPNQPAFRRRMAPQGDRHTGSIRSRFIPSGNESNQLPRQDRETIRRPCNDEKLEHN